MKKVIIVCIASILDPLHGVILNSQVHEAEVAQEQAIKQAEAARAEQARLAEAVAAAEVILVVL